MAKDNTGKAGRALGATTILLGASFGVAAPASAGQSVVDQASFKEKLRIIRQAVEAGEISPLLSDGKQWVIARPRQVNVADWLLTWSKAANPDFGKV